MSDGGDGHGAVPSQEKVEETPDQQSKTGDRQQQLVTGALQTDDQNNEVFLTRLEERLKRVDVQQPSVQIKFKQLRARAKIQVGDTAVPTLLSACSDLVLDALSKARLLKRSQAHFEVLKDISGVLQPGRITLLLGPPAGGKSTLLGLLSGQLQKNTDLELGGEVTYNGQPLSSFVPERVAGLVPQDDVHIAKLTVQETLDLSASWQGKGRLPALLKVLREREGQKQVEVDADLDAFLSACEQGGVQDSASTAMQLRLLGLEECRATLVGDNVLRGVSGGQKKRVTTGDITVGPSRVLLMDEITTGLDSSNAFTIVQCFAHIAHHEKATILMALLQPAPEVFELFDDIMLLAEGRVVFAGPREELVPFFSWIGLRCPERKNIADFVQEVCSEVDQEQYWGGPKGDWEFIPVRDLAQAFTETPMYQATQEALEAPCNAADDLPQELDPLVHHKYALSNMESFKVCLRREIILMKRNAPVFIFRIAQMVVLVIIASTLLIRPIMHPDNFETGQLFVSMPFGILVGLMMDNFSEMAFMVETLPVYFRQRGRYYYPAWTWALPTTLLRIPYSFVIALLSSCILYWVIGFAPSAGRFWSFVFLFMLAHQLASTLFRTIAAITRSLVLAYPLAWLIFLTILLLGGFILNKRDVHVWDIGGYWSLPMSWIQNGLAINELTAPRWKRPDPGNPNQLLGDALLKSFDFRHSRLWIWLAFAFVIAWVVFLNLLLMAAATLLPAPRNKPGAMPKSALEARRIADLGYDADDGSDTQGQNAPNGTHHADGSNGDAAAKRNAYPADPCGQAPPGGSKSGSDNTHSHEGIQNGDGASVDGVGGLEEGHRGSTEASEGRGSMEAWRGTSWNSKRTRRGSTRKRKMQEGGGMILPFEPLSFTFDHIYFSVPGSSDAADPRNQKDEQGRMQLMLLRDVSGSFRPGVLTCLMGASGAGKTTLMDCLSGRKTSGNVQGEMLVNGHPKVQETFARISGYVEQFDIHAAGATVYEAVEFSAQMRLVDVDQGKMREFIDQVVDLAELRPIADASVGMPGVSGLSVEQRKRLTIAVELVANPAIIFMDEPTSGLDARAAAVVMRSIRNTVNTGRTVVATIHQPAEEIFASFDELLLLKRGGRVIYAGPLGDKCQQLLQHFQGLKGVRQKEDKINPATWMLEVTRSSEERRLQVDFADLYMESELHKANRKLIEECKQPPEGSQPLHFDSQFAVGYMRQFQLLLKRNAAEYWRMPEYNAVRIFFTIVFGLTLGSIYWRIGKERSSPEGISNLAGALLVANIFLGTSNASTVQPVAAAQRSVMYRERAAGYYAVYPFAAAQAVIELPYVAVQSVLFSCITYFMIYFIIDAGKFFWYLLFSLLTLLVFTFWGICCVALTPNTQFSATMASGVYTLWFIFSGFIIPFPRIKGWWIWYFYLDPLTYTVWGLVGSQLADVDDVFLQTPTGQEVSVRYWMDNYYGYYHGFLGYAVLVLGGFCLLFHGVAALALIKLNYLKR
ncbi:hypothetical protein WJX73_009787 [Symbiochloris irregularis]|uniref:ABC transporter domain-containing protein n=1 Tax=Symbiochloris irregularis TaxID=706552 RepID=A0AAW1P9F9_9CHLO